MEVIFSEKSEDELDNIDNSLRKMFFKHVEKISQMPPMRYMKFGLPFNVENVTKQARLIYYLEENKLYVLHCFKDHKEYERWYKSFK